MNELYKTITFVAVALVLTGAAFVSTRDRTKTGEDFNDQGKPFFEDFKDPLACTDLEVVEFDPSTATATRFHVMFKDKKWVIPSHYNYPADAKDRLAKTSAALMDLTKDTIRSDNSEAQQSMGVVDPLNAKVTTSRDAANVSPFATRPRKSSPTSSSATISKTPSARRAGRCTTSVCPGRNGHTA